MGESSEAPSGGRPDERTKGTVTGNTSSTHRQPNQGSLEPEAPHFDTMQVCGNGHIITTTATKTPIMRKAYCPDCGAPTFTKCQRCITPIPGAFVDGTSTSTSAPLKDYCIGCGEAYPWRRAALKAAQEAFQMGLGEDAGRAIELLPLVSVESPMTSVAAVKLGKIIAAGVKGPGLEVVKKTLIDVAAASAKQLLGL